jgi:hypothetical protein
MNPPSPPPPPAIPVKRRPSRPRKVPALSDHSDADDFWANIFVSVKTGKPPKDSAWTPKQGIKLLNMMISQGIHNPERFDVGLSDADTILFVHAILLLMISFIPPSDLPFWSLINSVIYSELFHEPFTFQFNQDVGFWVRTAAEDPLLRQPVFKTGCLVQTIRQRHENVLRVFERHWIVNAFLSIRADTYVPPRFPMHRDFISGPDVVHKLLQTYCELGDESPEWLLQLNVPGLTLEFLKSRFTVLYSAVYQDVLSYALHRLDHFCDKPFLRPVINIHMRGPFLPTWTESEHQHIIKAIYNFGFPLYPNEERDWLEFHAISQLTTKSVVAVRHFVSLLIEGLSRTPRGEELYIPAERICLIEAPGIAEQPFRMPAQNVGTMKSRMQLLNYLRQFTVNPPHQFRPQLVHAGWTLRHDIALVQGICQFGYARVSILPTIVVDHYDQNAGNVVMSHSLEEFRDFVTNHTEILQRLRIIIVMNCRVRRRVCLIMNSVRQVSFYVSPESLPPPQWDKAPRKEKLKLEESEAPRPKSRKDSAITVDEEKSRTDLKDTVDRDKGRQKVKTPPTDEAPRKEKGRPGKPPKVKAESPPPKVREPPKTRLTFVYGNLPRKFIFV